MNLDSYVYRFINSDNQAKRKFSMNFDKSDMTKSDSDLYSHVNSIYGYS